MVRLIDNIVHEARYKLSSDGVHTRCKIGLDPCYAGGR
jgi:hypothetical protein